MKQLLRLWSFSLIIPGVFAFSWTWPASASNLSKEESTSVLLDVPYLSLLLLQEERKGKPPPPDKANNPNERKDEAKNPNNSSNRNNEVRNEEDAQNSNNPIKKSADAGSGLPTGLIIALISVVGAAGLWFVLRTRSS